MSSCELCGKSSDSLTRVKVEGATLKACDTCKDMGTEVKSQKTSKKQTKKKKKKNRVKNQGDNQVLINEYGKRIKEARESKELTIKELASKLNEKESVISKLEREALKPGKSLAEKIGKKLDIELYTNPSVHDYNDESSDSRKATLGDVADIKD